MKDEFSGEAFIARLEDMCSLAVRRGQTVYSSFLNDREQFEVLRHLSRRADVSVQLWGGDESCARKMLGVSDARGYAEVGTEDFPIYPLTLTFRKADKPMHKDFLGAFMALGIKRETVGDIFVGEGAAAVFCTKTARDMIYDGIETVGRVGVSVSDGISDTARKCIQSARFDSITVTAASERADCVISGITGLSREKSASFIRSGGFMLNYSECDSISKTVSEGDVLTLRGYGKYVVCDDGDTTKKGRIKINLKKYI